VAVSTGRIGRHRADFAQFHAKFGRRGRRGGFLDRIASTLPGDERAIADEEWRRILEEDRQRRHRARGHRVVRARPLVASPLLSPYGQRANLDPGRLREALDHLALAAGGLDQIDARGRHCGRQDEAWKSRTGADVGDRSRRPERTDIKPLQAVGNVDVDSLRGRTHRGRRIRFGGQGLEEGRCGLDKRRRQLVPRG
jgi:hypothetical protein